MLNVGRARPVLSFTPFHEADLFVHVARRDTTLKHKKSATRLSAARPRGPGGMVGDGPAPCLVKLRPDLCPGRGTVAAEGCNVKFKMAILCANKSYCSATDVVRREASII